MNNALLRSHEECHDGAWPPLARRHDNSEPLCKLRYVQGFISVGPNFSRCLGAASEGGFRDIQGMSRLTDRFTEQARADVWVAS